MSHCCHNGPGDYAWFVDHSADAVVMTPSVGTAQLMRTKLMSRQNISSGRPWEQQAGYSRAVRVGDLFETSLTSPSAADGSIQFSGDVYRQTARALEIIGDSLREAGLEFSDVIRTRIYMIDTLRWADAGRAHAEVFSEILPALSFIGVRGFFDPLIDVEVEVVAYAPQD
jgi:enamine deaminase RidA (YjgF/YER057c/UK114 family)